MNEAKHLVTVITSTLGRPSLKKCVDSVLAQTYPAVQHLVIGDGVGLPEEFQSYVEDGYIDFVSLPYATGKDRYNGHRNLAAGVYLAKGSFIVFLDDDNTIEPNHIESCAEAVSAPNTQWSYSLRNIVDQQGQFLCQDNCENLGNWASVCAENDYFVDVNSYFLPKDLALAITPIMHRKFREPGQMEIDRAMSWALRKMNTKATCTGEYTVNYAVGGSELSVKPEFFLQGNQIMSQRWPNGYPWQGKQRAKNRPTEGVTVRFV